ncbi:hypothetical protein FEF34_23535 [Streptomyces marianii]|uniref:Uncharacterized protein n=1 Tax=Streptomyces marianii TaxID=1817406 RepID=A0A5R9E8N1_9ACTN|nr:hypothetical protein FEF34_23535 [Streptomyces marianii]
MDTAPSRISPTPSGRSGITPGFAAGGCPQPPRCGPPPQPGPPVRGGTGPPPGPVGGAHRPPGGCSLDHFEEVSGASAGPGAPASRSSDGEDPGEAQPGVSFTVVHLVDVSRSRLGEPAGSRRLSARQGGRLAAIVPRTGRGRAGPWISFSPALCVRQRADWADG